MPGVQTCARSEEHTSELQSHDNLVCRLLLEKKKQEARSAPLARAGGRSRRTAGEGRAPRPCVPPLQPSLAACAQPVACPPRRFFFFKGSGAPRDLPLSPTRPLPI